MGNCSAAVLGDRYKVNGPSFSGQGNQGFLTLIPNLIGCVVFNDLIATNGTLADQLEFFRQLSGAWIEIDRVLGPQFVGD